MERSEPATRGIDDDPHAAPDVAPGLRTTAGDGGNHARESRRQATRDRAGRDREDCVHRRAVWCTLDVHDPDESGAPVQIIRRYASRIEADLAVSFLRSQGIEAVTRNDDAGGLHPELAYGLGGSRLLVPDVSADEAVALLDDVEASDAPTTFVLVHGAWHGGWVWDPVVERLAERGHRTVVVELPSSALDPDELGGFGDDVAAVRAAITAAGGEVVLVGHSYGGVVITEVAADEQAVSRLIYVAALLLEEGGSLAGQDDRDLPAWVELNADGLASRVRTPLDVFYTDVPEDEATQAAARLGWQATDALRGRVTTAGWRTLPTTYVVCDQDVAIPPAAQEAMARHAGVTVHLDTGHSPFLSRPDELTEALLGAAG